jgi:hypothetical protein
MNHSDARTSKSEERFFKKIKKMTPEDGIKYTLKKLCRDTCRSWLYDKIDGELDCPMCGISQQKRIEDGMCHGLHNSHVGLGFAKMLDNVLSTFLMSHDYTQNPYNESVGIVKSKFIELHTNALNSKKCAIQVSCSKCNPKIEKCTVAEIELWKLRGKDAWKEAKYGTLIPRRDDGRSSEKSARPGDIRYFMGVRGNGADVSDSDSPNDNGGSVSDSDDIYDDNGTMSDDTIGDASDTTLSDSPTDSDTSMVLRETTLSGQKRPMQTSSAFSRESSADNKRRRRKTIPTPLTTDENEVFEEWCSTWHIVKGSKIAAMAALGHTPESLYVPRPQGNGVGFVDIAYIDEDCPRPRRNCRNSEDFSRNGQNLSKRLSKDKIEVEPAKTHFSIWKEKIGLVYDNTTELWGCKTRPRKTRPKYHEKCAKVWDSYEKFSANLDNKHRFNKSTFQNVMKERGFDRVQSELRNPCGYEGNDWYYTNLKVTGEECSSCDKDPPTPVFLAV